MVGICSAIVSLVIGVPLGLIAGYFRGWVETIIMRVSDIFMSFPSMILILGFSQCIGAVTYNGYVGNRISWVDGICKIDLCKCFVHTRERLCRIGKGDWYEKYTHSAALRFAEFLGTGYHFFYLPYCTGNHYGVITELPWVGRTASGSLMGKYFVLCTVDQRVIQQAVYVGTGRNPSGFNCTEHQFYW